MLLRPASKILVDNLSATSVVANSAGTGIIIENYGEILLSEVIDSYCQCPSACTSQRTVVCITIPDSCECPYEWPLLIRTLPCVTSYEVQQTFGSSKYYGYQTPSGAAPTANQTAIAVAANINADPTATVSAIVGNYVAPNFIPAASGTCLLLTEINCELTCGFQAFSDAATLTTGTAHVDAVLSTTHIAKIFPIQWGFVGSRPSLGMCGTHCVYHLRLRKSCDVQDISQANAFNCYEQEVYFYVNSTVVLSFNTFWADIFAAEGFSDCTIL